MKGILASFLLAASIALPSFIHAAEANAAAKRASPVKAGEIAPDFTLTDQNGVSRTLSTERGRRPVVLVFYRGYW